ncbi:proteobacterial dedicated sortase system response regulator [Kangiella sp. HZ709]|uniref:proteobacterial dedicated sortase system response regulator n=1 Tax=Kangiella sp. HZ709 TaxID=2666328 RepID=UPI0012AEFDE3|nr:proteobacterial dedicated sortase system response regulator [Kangiella sp. HZ709]MRX28356.1 proteobacterial dedicated sortase system response regulator [Kangiella sp. HZ709]
MAKRIALVEDEPLLQQNYSLALKKSGYEVMVYGDKASALTSFKNRLPDLVLLDIGLGDEPEAGFEVCRKLRTQSTQLPIIFLTALDSDFDIISGLRLGADDYLTKDISIPHLLARISALFRRMELLTQTEQVEETIKAGDLTIDNERLAVKWQQQLVDLTVTEFWIVCALAQKPGHVKSREQLMQAVKAVVDDSTITSHIKRIRQKFQTIDAEFDHIDTVYGMGYRWNLRA